ncbi:MAG TPA: hypothetical protein VMZ26_08665 [Pyrinomonadaceae bacterium]|nr:hypothetical protein [Pyrinomonadaceae bacterium]
MIIRTDRFANLYETIPLRLRPIDILPSCALRAGLPHVTNLCKQNGPARRNVVGERAMTYAYRDSPSAECRTAMRSLEDLSAVTHLDPLPKVFLWIIDLKKIPSKSVFDGISFVR